MNSFIRRSTTPLGAIIAAFALFTVLIIFLIASRVGATNGNQSQNGHLITIHDRGNQTVVLSQSGTIGDALKQAGVKIDKRDTVEPAASEKLVASEYQVNIYRARSVLVIDGATKQKIITPYQTAAQIAKSAGITLYNEDKTVISRTDNMVSEGASLRMTIIRATPFTLTLYGQTTTVRTQAKTVGAMLREKGIKLSKDDRVSLDQRTKLSEGLAVRVWREGKQTVTTDEAINFATDQVQDGDQLVGYRAVKIAGANGMRSVTYEVTIQDGQEVGRTEIASLTTKEPVRQVEIVGAKRNISGSLSDWLASLRSCETGGNYARNSGNGYYGAYQFLPATWDATARSTGNLDVVGLRPDLASPASQDAMIVANTNASRGGLASQNPGCYQKLGLSQFPPN